VEADVFDVAGLVEQDRALGEAFNVVLGKNEPMIGGRPRNSLVLVKFEESSGIAKVAQFALAAIPLEVAELVEGFLELAGEALAVEAE
jgi:hypothetical protein